MLKILVSMLFTLALSMALHAQTLIPLDEAKYLEEIHHNIEFSSNEKERLYNYLLLSEYWAQTESDKSKQALEKVQSSSQKKLLDQGVLAYYQAIHYAHQGDKKLAIQHYKTAIDAFNKNEKNQKLLVKALYNFAYLQVEDKGYDFMVKTLVDQCIPISKESGDSELLAFFYTQTGLTFMSVGQFETAEEYHLKALDELKKLPDESTSELLTYLNLVSNYCYKPDSASAKIYLDKAENIIENYPNSQHYPNYYYQEALFHTTKQNYNQALISLEKGEKLATKRKQNRMLHMLYFRKYNIHLMQKDYPKAKAQLEFILEENILGKEAVNRRITYTQLAAVNEVLNNYKEAYEWMKKSSALGDSLQQIKLLEKMKELDVLHQTTEKQQTIDLLELEKKENEHLNQSNSQRITFLAIALLLSLVIVFLIYRTYQNQKQLNNQININHQQELLHIKRQRKYEATQAILKGEEQERQRIAQDLHDSIGGMLANIRMSISKEESEYASDILEKLDKSIIEMRRISRNLMPETLKNLGLEVALKELCESMSQKQFHIQFEAFNLDQKIPFKVQLSIYRIAQESISNIIKYAQANNVIVQISQHDQLLNLTVEDDGVGFDSKKTVYGLGIKNIKNRTQLINGTVDIQSEIGKGTTINIECYV